MGKKISIAVIGTIGVGKSTLISRLRKALVGNPEQTAFPAEVLVYGEPSVTIDFVKDALKRFYNDTRKWAYPLQAGVAGAQEINHQILRDTDYDFAIVDAPFSSYVYCSIHAKAGRLTDEEKRTIDAIARPFPFDYVVLVEETAETTIDRIMKRNRSIELNDLLYLHEHIRDYKEFQEEYIDKYFPGAEVMRLSNLPDDLSDEYRKVLQGVVDKVSA